MARYKAVLGGVEFEVYLYPLDEPLDGPEYARCVKQAKAYKSPDREKGAFDVLFTPGDKVPYDYTEPGPPGDDAVYALAVVTSFPKFANKQISKVWIRLDERWEAA